MFIPYVDFSGSGQIVFHSKAREPSPVATSAIARSLREDGEKQGVYMRIIMESNRHFLSRAASVLALSGVVALSACQDATSPEKVDSPTEIGALTPAAQVVANATVEETASTIVDATSWVLSSIEDADARANMASKIQAIADHAAAKQYTLARQDVTAARAIMSKLDEGQLTEIGPIDVSLFEIDAALKRANY
jgi:hypothetical protein